MLEESRPALRNAPTGTSLTKSRAVARGQFVNPAKHGSRIGDPEEGQILVQGLWIKLGLDTGNFQQRLDLRGESEPVSLMEVIKRLHAEVIAR